MWNWNRKEGRGYGFVKDGDGYEFYMSSSRLLFDGRDLQKGMAVRFEVELVEERGKCNAAVDVVLN